MAKEIWHKLTDRSDFVYKFGKFHNVINIERTRQNCLYHILCMTRVGGLLRETEKEKYFSYWDKVQHIVMKCLGDDFISETGIALKELNE